jgi:hypothetical protein
LGTLDYIRTQLGKPDTWAAWTPRRIDREYEQTLALLRAFPGSCNGTAEEQEPDCLHTEPFCPVCCGEDVEDDAALAWRLIRALRRELGAAMKH